MNPDGNEEWEMKSTGRVGGGQLRRRGGEAGWQPRVFWVWSVLLFFFDGEAKLVGFVRAGGGSKCRRVEVSKGWGEWGRFVE